MCTDWLAVLITRGLLSNEKIRQASELARERKLWLEEQLVTQQFCTPEDIAMAKEEAYAVDAADRRQARVLLWTMSFPNEILELLPESVCRENTIFPLQEGTDRLVIAVADPSNSEVPEKLCFILNRTIEIRLAWADDIRRAIDHYYGPASD